MPTFAITNILNTSTTGGRGSFSRVPYPMSILLIIMLVLCIGSGATSAFAEPNPQTSTSANFLRSHVSTKEKTSATFVGEVCFMSQGCSLGQLYQLGAHRVMCGDSSKIENVQTLMNGATSDLIYTDPPYGVNLNAKNKSLKEYGCGKVWGDIVLDVFLGSGSTLIAAERLGRKCYGMELSPSYCQATIDRWESETGQQAVRL